MYYRPTLLAVLRYAITEGPVPGESAEVRRERLLACASRWAAQGIAYAQLREKEIDAGELLALAQGMLALFHEARSRTKLLVNSRADVAAAAGADGFHLTAHPDELTADQVRQVFALAKAQRPIVSISCHTLAEVQRAREAEADLILFGPVFEKRIGNHVVAQGLGVEALRSACTSARGIPTFALGGVTRQTAASCIAAGAAGIAGIRMASSTQPPVDL